MQAFSLSAQFARESAMLKLPEERRRWGESKGAGRGQGERREFFFLLPSPSPLSFFRPRTYRKGYYFYSPQSFIKSKMAAATILRTRKRMSSRKTKMLLLERRLYSTNVDCFVRDSSLVHLTFAAFCLLSVICKL